MTEQEGTTQGNGVAPNGVAVYDIGDAGATGPKVGTGLLIGPELVLVHPTLAQQLASDDGRHLRVGISSGQDAERIVEVVDVAEVLVSPAKTDKPVVGLALRTAAVSPVDILGMTGEGDALTAMVSYLDTVDEHTPTPQVPPVRNEDKPPWCRVWPCGPGCDC